jgi:GDP-L-fucose synthase
MFQGDYKGVTGDIMNASFWKGAKVLVTGGAGFLGKHLVPKLVESGADVFIPRAAEFDLRKENKVKDLFRKTKPEIVIHLAVHGGGIGYMRKHPAAVYYDNILMNTHMVHHSWENGVKKFVGIGTVCEYPKYTPVPFKEDDLWNGYPEETNATYGLSKRMLLVQTQAYRLEYGFNGIHMLLANMYGPHDNFDPQQSHVIPALIQKMFRAKTRGEKDVVVWGTGKASREFLYAEDAADGIILATEKYNKPDPVNIGTGKETTIKELVDIIAELVGFGGEIVWDKTKPDGQPKRHLDVSRAEKEFGFVSKTDLRAGLKKTIEWYKKHYIKQVCKN